MFETRVRESRLKDNQIVVMPREAHRVAIPMVARRHRVSEPTIYTRKKRFRLFRPDDVRWLK